MIDYTIHHIEPYRVRDIAPVVGAIYRDAFGVPQDEAQRFLSGALAKHCTYSDFRMFVASIEEIAVGFVYGYRSLPGQWWYDTIRTEIVRHNHAEWQTDAFELAEVAVHPQAQRLGIGRALITTFLDNAPNRHVLLSTETRSPAHRLYQSFGFIDLLPGFRYPGFDDDTTIMGLRRSR